MNNQTNTKINLLYVDADNYKTSLEVVVNGAITSEQIDIIKENLVDGMFVIAHQVGLPTPSENFKGKDNFPNEDIDHVYTQLPDFFGEAPTPASFATSERASADITIEQLAKSISEATWDIEAEQERLGFYDSENCSDEDDEDDEARSNHGSSLSMS